MMLSPGLRVWWYFPRRCTTYSWPWGTILTPATMVMTTSANRTKTKTVNTGMISPFSVQETVNTLRLAHLQFRPQYIHDHTAVPPSQGFIGGELPPVGAQHRHGKPDRARGKISRLD